MIVADYPLSELRQRLKGSGLRLRTGPVVTRIRTRLESVVRGISLHYAAHPVDDESGFADFHVIVERPHSIRRWIMPQIQFLLDGELPFSRLAAAHAFPMLEWGLNWCISNHCHQYVMVHAAVVERGGRALILPAPPGSGKSTLCAGLTFSGWRLLSDELTLVEPRTGRVVPVPRPVSLKNASIDVIRHFEPSAVFGPVVRDTAKGNVAHVKPPADGVMRCGELAQPAWVVMPRYEAGATARLEPLSKARAFMHLVDNSFNYSAHGRRGFDVFARLIDACDCFEFTYSRLEDAARIFNKLAESDPPRATGAR